MTPKLNPHHFSFHILLYLNSKQTRVNFKMAGDERIELPTKVLEDIKTPVIK